MGLEAVLLDTGYLTPDEIPNRDKKSLRQVFREMDTICYSQQLTEKLIENPISREQAEKTVAWALSGNQECYRLAERDSGYTINALISIAN